MIRGALIFAAGLALGYAKAVSEMEEIKEFLETFRAASAQTAKTDVEPEGESAAT